MDKLEKPPLDTSSFAESAPLPSPPGLPEQLKILMRDGLFDQAADLLQATDTKAEIDAPLHHQLAVLAEELGVLDKAVLEYNLSLRDVPEQPAVLLRLARLRRDQGDGDRALRAYGRLLQLEPENVQARIEAADVLVELGRYGESANLLRVGLAYSENVQLKTALRRLNIVDGSRVRSATACGFSDAGTGDDYDGTSTSADPNSDYSDNSGNDEKRMGDGAVLGLGTGVEAGPKAGPNAVPVIGSDWGANQETGRVDPGANRGSLALRSDCLVPDDVDLVVFSSLFAGREGFYARQWASASGKHGYTPIAEPFTPHVARGHLLGNHTIGIYPVRMDHSALFLAFDIDIAKFALGRWNGAGSVVGSGVGEGKSGASGGRAALPGHPMLRLAHQVAVGLVRAAASLGVPAYLEDSGSKGRHVWIFFETPIPAVAARRIGNAIIAGSPVACPPEITIEVFPKQNRVDKDGGLGNLIKLPLGIHLVSGSRSLFLDEGGRPVREQLAYIRSIKRLSRVAVADLLRGLSVVDDPLVTRGSGGHMPRQGQLASRQSVNIKSSRGYEVAGLADEMGVCPGVVDEVDDLPELDELDELCGSYSEAGNRAHGGAAAGSGLRPGSRPGSAQYVGPLGAAGPEVPQYNLDADEEFLWLTQKCPVIAQIVRRVREDRILPNSHRLIVTYTVGHLPTGPQAVNTILSFALNTDRSLFLKSTLKGNPMSCPKIRSHLSDLASAVECNCRFNMRDGMYPTPLLHLQSLRLSGTIGASPGELGMLQVERMVSDLFRLRGEIERSERLARQIESRLLEVMNEHQVRELSVPSGILRLQPASGGQEHDELVLGLPGESVCMAGGGSMVVGTGVGEDVAATTKETR